MKEYLPIGTIVILKEGTKKIMIYGRRQREIKTGKEYDYIACLYPQGNINEDYMFLFNDEDIDNVVYRGYSDSDEEEFLEILNSMEIDSNEEAIEEPSEEVIYENNDNSKYYDFHEDESSVMEENSTESFEFIEDEEECDYGTTVLGLNMNEFNKLYLIQSSTNKKIEIDKEHFTFGRSLEDCDYAINNKAVGRLHASVVSLNGEQYLVDNDSKNGSFINGYKLVPGRQYKLRTEDTIKLANEEFTFIIE